MKVRLNVTHKFQTCIRHLKIVSTNHVDFQGKHNAYPLNFVHELAASTIS